MGKNYHINRRDVLGATTLGALGLIIPTIGYGFNPSKFLNYGPRNRSIPEFYPHLSPELVSSVVGKSHSDLDGVKSLVDKRPELARSVWDWRYGDFESAIGAASHVGRRDIALYLISKGARPTLFTFAMLGEYEVVKSIIESAPGIQKSMGPHGISLLSHAYAGERMTDKMSGQEIENVRKTIAFLEALGDAAGETYLDVSPDEQQKYLGDYKYGSGEKEGFTIDINMRKLLSLGPIGGFGGALFKIAENKFIYNGAPSVQISFQFVDDEIKSLKIEDPDITVIAEKA